MVFGGRKAGRAGLALATGLAGAATLDVAAAEAGGFLQREQSAQSVGVATAGAAADGVGLSSMVFNGATITDYPGIQASAAVMGVMPDAEMRSTSDSTLSGIRAFKGVIGNTTANSGDVANDRALPSGFVSVQLTDRLWFGLTANEPFGFSSSAPQNWYGATMGITTKVSSYEVLPILAYKITETVSVSGGLQALHLGVYQRSLLDMNGFTAAIFQDSSFTSPFAGKYADESWKGSSWGFGWTLGALWKPNEATELGIGYRSSVKENMKGEARFGEQVAVVQPNAVGSYPAQMSLALPDILTIGLRQRIDPRTTLLAGFEFDRWTRIQSMPITSLNGGTTYGTLAPNYKNGWMVSMGGEFVVTNELLLRAGTAYEKSPTDNANRTVSLPDADKVWVSMGAALKFSERLSADIGYSHAFGMKGTINQSQSLGTTTLTDNSVSLISDAKISADIVSLAVNYRFDNPAPRPQPVAPPVTAKY